MGQTTLFSASPSRLEAWTPGQWSVAPDWRPVVDVFLQSHEGRALAEALKGRLAVGATIYPAQPFRALALTPLAEVRVVILGQDPYHGPGQAEGLAFSVARGIPLPPSLRNIYKELARDPALPSWTRPDHGSLVSWAEQGVLLLNTCLTVEEGRPASHAKLGWEVLTNAIVSVLAAREQPTVFLLWGAHAQKVAAAAGLMERVGRHCVLTANHPSPLSALRPPEPFLGCGHFSRARDFLLASGRGELSW